MALVKLYEAKNYLRVDTSDDDSLIGALLSSACRLCADVARLTDEEWAVIDGNDEQDIYSEDELSHIRETMRVAILYTLGYLYEHREEGDHSDLTLTLRALLFSIREGK